MPDPSIKAKHFVTEKPSAASWVTKVLATQNYQDLNCSSYSVSSESFSKAMGSATHTEAVVLRCSSK